MIENIRDYPSFQNLAPISFIATKWLQNLGIRGGHRLEKFCIESEMWNSHYRVELGKNIQVEIPLWKRPFDKKYLENYERIPIAAVCETMESSGKKFFMVDCGADIGVFTALVAARSNSIYKAVGFEPNRESWKDLSHNYSLLPFQAIALNKAVSHFFGSAVLDKPEFDSHDHAAFIRPCENGDISVVTIDSLNLGELPGVFLKIDVEGEELNVIRGAKETIESAEKSLVLFEAHRRQSQRVSVDPCEILRELSEIRPCRFKITEAPKTKIHLDRPFFSQVAHLRQGVFNILVYFD